MQLLLIAIAGAVGVILALRNRDRDVTKRLPPGTAEALQPLFATVQPPARADTLIATPPAPTAPPPAPTPAASPFAAIAATVVPAKPAIRLQVSALSIPKTTSQAAKVAKAAANPLSNANNLKVGSSVFAPAGKVGRVI